MLTLAIILTQFHFHQSVYTERKAYVRRLCNVSDCSAMQRQVRSWSTALDRMVLQWKTINAKKIYTDIIDKLASRG